MSQGKRNVIKTTLQSHDNKMLFKQYIEYLVEQVYEANCFQPPQPRKRKEKVMPRQTMNLNQVPQTMTFRQPFNRLKCFKNLFDLQVEVKDSEEDPLDYIAKKWDRVNQEQNLNQLDNAVLETCEIDTQHVTSAIPNLYKGPTSKLHQVNKLLDCVNSLRVLISQDEKIIITSSQSMVAFHMLCQDHQGRFLKDLSSEDHPHVQHRVEFTPTLTESKEEIWNEEQLLEFKELFSDPSYPVAHIVLQAQLKPGQRDFFRKVKCKVEDENGHVQIDEVISKHLSIDEPEKQPHQQLLLMKIQRQSYQPLENKKLPVDIKKENVTIDWEESKETFRLNESKFESKPCNYYFEKLNFPCNKSDIESIPLLLKFLHSQRLQLPVMMRLNAQAFKSEVEIKKNNKKSKTSKLTQSELLTKCQEQFEIPFFKDFVVEDFRMPFSNENIKNFCNKLNNSIASRMPSWKNMFSNSFLGGIGLYNKEGLITSTEMLIKEIQSGHEILVQFLSRQDILDLQPKDANELDEEK